MAPAWRSLWRSAVPGCASLAGTRRKHLNDYLAETIAEAGMSARVRVEPIDKYDLPFEAGSFDLVVFRGGLFFWEEQERIVAEMNRVLKPGGMGAHGGGFGAGASDALIESLLPEARALNDRLGKKRLSRDDVRQIAENAGTWRLSESRPNTASGSTGRSGTSDLRAFHPRNSPHFPSSQKARAVAESSCARVPRRHFPTKKTPSIYRKTP